MENTRTESLNGQRKPLQADAHFEKSLQEKAQSLGEMASTFASTTSNYLKSGKDYVKANPNKSVAIAAAAGIVTGSLVSMAMRKRQ